ncbi:lipid droplet-associated protein [Rhodococcus sp. Q]|uniref:lipid droplet-associated protein n=1 Tax=Rhodococcus sp. Q TaxID=2502252 RepID=UPI0010F75D05|nr:lipid droplet-associated protein [Rhodococcus sp. Q]
MFRPPFAARVAAGIAVTLVEEVQKLPTTAITLPMTAVSQVLQTGMHVQQTVTALAIKGDEALAVLFPPTDDQPSWATFDEDAPAPVATNGRGVPESPSNTSNNGRFELYSMSPTTDGQGPESATESEEPVATATGERPEIADYLDYDNLTLAQLRARLRSLSVDELTALLDYENGTRERAPFLTMLGNRITAATAK